MKLKYNKILISLSYVDSNVNSNGFHRLSIYVTSSNHICCFKFRKIKNLIKGFAFVEFEDSRNAGKCTQSV